MTLLTLAITGCQRDEVESSTAEPSIKILSPQPNSVLTGSTITVDIDIENFILDPLSIGKGSIPGTGHWHLYLDGDWIGAEAKERLEAKNIPPGPHHLRAALANNDHSLLIPSIEHSIVIEVIEDPMKADQSASTNERALKEVESAHFVSSTPYNGETLYSTPEFVQVVFDFDLAPESSITIESDGVPVYVTSTKVSSDKRSMFVTLNETLSSGHYQVNYKACWPLLNCHSGSFAFEIVESGQSDDYDYDY